MSFATDHYENRKIELKSVLSSKQSIAKDIYGGKEGTLLMRQIVNSILLQFAQKSVDDMAVAYVLQAFSEFYRPETKDNDVWTRYRIVQSCIDSLLLPFCATGALRKLFKKDLPETIAFEPDVEAVEACLDKSDRLDFYTTFLHIDQEVKDFLLTTAVLIQMPDLFKCENTKLHMVGTVPSRDRSQIMLVLACSGAGTSIQTPSASITLPIGYTLDTHLINMHLTKLGLDDPNELFKVLADALHILVTSVSAHLNKTKLYEAMIAMPPTSSPYDGPQKGAKGTVIYSEPPPAPDHQEHDPFEKPSLTDDDLFHVVTEPSLPADIEFYADFPEQQAYQEGSVGQEVEDPLFEMFIDKNNGMLVNRRTGQRYRAPARTHWRRQAHGTRWSLRRWQLIRSRHPKGAQAKTDLHLIGVDDFDMPPMPTASPYRQPAQQAYAI